MKARNAREYKIRGHGLSLPYYRFGITSERISEQHSLLLSLEGIEPLTFYAAPGFHLNDEINEHWNSGSVTQDTVFVKPSTIGELPDLNPHRVCFDSACIAKGKAYFFSEPKEIGVLSFQSLSEFVIAAVDEETGTLEYSINRAREKYTSALEDAHRRERDRIERAAFSDDPPLEQISGIYRLQDRFVRDLQRLGGILSEPAVGRDLLRQVARVSSGVFGAQAIAVVME